MIKGKIRMIAGVAVIVLAVGYLIETAIRSTAEYYLTVGEVRAKAAELGGSDLRVAGRVVSDTVSWDPRSLTLRFLLEPTPAAAGQAPASGAAAGARLSVVCRGQPKPDMFAAGRDVIVEGRLVDGSKIEARQVLTSCPSKYVPAQEAKK